MTFDEWVCLAKIYPSFVYNDRRQIIYVRWYLILMHGDDKTGLFSRLESIPEGVTKRNVMLYLKNKGISLNWAY